MFSATARNIKEQEYPLKNGEIPLEIETAIVGKTMLRWSAYSTFWRPKIEKGKECYRGITAQIFSDAEKAKFKRQDKMLISVAEIMPQINALEGMQIAGRRPGVIIAEGEEDSPDVETATRILKIIQSENHLMDEMTCAFTDAMVTSYPSFIWYDLPVDWARRKTIEAYHEVWDAVLPDPNYRAVDLSDAESVLRIKGFTKDGLINKWPSRKAAIEARVKEGQFDDAAFSGTLFNASERSTILSEFVNATDTFGKSGLVYVVENLFFIQKEISVWVSPDDQGVTVLPFTWTPAEVEKWKSVNPQYVETRQDVRLLWVTACTTTGVLLENNLHWFQCNEFPCEMFVPRTFDNQPYGIVEFLLGSQKLKTTARMEHLHSLRMANDNLMKIKEGAVKNAADLDSEGGRVGGKVIIDQAFEMTDVEFVSNRREQLGWLELAEYAQEDLYRLLLDKNIQGGTQSSQESAKAVQARVKQGELKQSPYLNSYNGFDLRVNRKILKILPIALTEPQILRYISDDGKTQSVEVNQPEAWDWKTGAATKIKNNLKGSKYDYREAPGDDSTTGRMFELEQFTEVTKNVLPGMDVAYWPFLLSSIPNRIANEFGRKVQARLDAEAAAPPPHEPMKKTLSIAGKDLLYNPLIQQVLAQEGIQLQLPQAGAVAVPPQGNNAPAIPAGAMQQ